MDKQQKYEEKRNYRIQVFRDTLSKLKEEDIEKSINESKVYLETNSPIFKSVNVSKYIVNKLRSFEAVENFLSVYTNKKVKIAVLNFASAKNPGGMVIKGSNAQEESLCRVSSLYPVISNNKFKKEYYDYHRNKEGTIYSDRLIYSPNIKIIKDDDFNDLINPITVDVITCAAPNLNIKSFDEDNGDFQRVKSISSIDDNELFNIHYSRCTNIIRAASEHNIDVLVLGAFGCGVFKNNPYVVAKAMKKALEDSPYKFYRVIFPIFCGKPDDEINYKAFKEVFSY